MGFYQDHCLYLPPMAGWFLFSALLSSMNKVIFGQDYLAFPCPLLMTSLHFLCQWLFASAVCRFFPVETGRDRVSTMPWKTWLAISVPCAVVTALDVGLSNLSVVYITLTFYTMVKSSTPIFVLLWAYAFGLERITFPLLAVVFIIAVGELLTVVGEVDFQLVGFLLCLTAAFLSGARWTLVQLKIQSLDPPLKTTFTTMRLLAPSMFVILFHIAMIVERPWHRLRGMSQEDALFVAGLGFLAALLAICMILCEFYLIMHSSAMVIMIGGVVKELLTIVVGVSFFKDELNSINLVGCFVVFLGVLLYKITFHMQKADEKELDSLSDRPSSRGFTLRFPKLDPHGHAILKTNRSDGDLVIHDGTDSSSPTTEMQPLSTLEDDIKAFADEEEQSSSPPAARQQAMVGRGGIGSTRLATADDSSSSRGGGDEWMPHHPGLHDGTELRKHVLVNGQTRPAEEHDHLRNPTTNNTVTVMTSPATPLHPHPLQQPQPQQRAKTAADVESRIPQ